MDFHLIRDTAKTGEYSRQLADAIVRGIRLQQSADRERVACPIEATELEEQHLLENKKRWGSPEEHGALPATLLKRGLQQQETPLQQVLRRPGGPERLDGHPVKKPRPDPVIPSLTRLLRRPGGPDMLDGHPKKKKKQQVDEDEWEWREEFEEAPRSPEPER